MSEMTQGTITVTYPDHIPIPEKAGKMTPVEVSRTPRARRGLGLMCEKTAEAMTKYPDKIQAAGVTATQLQGAGKAAEDIDVVVTDVENLLVVLRQANLLLDAEAHTLARKVLASVRAQEKFDPKIADLVPHLISYFSTTRPAPGAEPGPDPTK
jgi:hypothetical protein